MLPSRPGYHDLKESSHAWLGIATCPKAFYSKFSHTHAYDGLADATIENRGVKYLAQGHKRRVGRKVFQNQPSTVLQNKTKTQIQQNNKKVTLRNYVPWAFSSFHRPAIYHQYHSCWLQHPADTSCRALQSVQWGRWQGTQTWNELASWPSV